MNIYVDVDDVVADWMKTAREFLKTNWDYANGERLPKEVYDQLKNQSRFYRDLPLKHGATDLMNYLRHYTELNPATRLAFLTAIPRSNSMPFSVQDKVWWADEHFPGIPLFIGPYSTDKWQHCTPGDILLDDRSSNCQEWRIAGGLAHQYTTWENCKPWLEETLNG